MYVNLVHHNKHLSSWLIFAAGSDPNSKEYAPIGCSSANFTFEQYEKQKLDNLRTWVRTHFKEKKSLFYKYETKLIDRNNSNTSDLDVLVQVVFKTELDDKIVLFVQDETDGCELHVFKYFNFVEVYDVIRIRSFKVFDKDVILMNKFSNILKIPHFTDYYKEFINKIALKMKNLDPSADVPIFGKDRIEDNAIMDIENQQTTQVSFIPSNKEAYPLRLLNDIKDIDGRIVLRLNVLEVYPTTIYELVSILCTNCEKRYLFNNQKINLN